MYMQDSTIVSQDSELQSVWSGHLNRPLQGRAKGQSSRPCDTLLGTQASGEGPQHSGNGGCRGQGERPCEPTSDHASDACDDQASCIYLLKYIQRCVHTFFPYLQDVTQFKGKVLSANLPYLVKFNVSIDGADVKFQAHLGEDEINAA